MRWMIALCLWAGLASADPVVDRLETAFDDWMAAQEVMTGSLAILKDGVLVNAPDPAPVELASLSKAITAVCVMHLVDEGLLSYETQTHEFTNLGPEGLTVAQLLTHSGGLWPDQSQGLFSTSRFGVDRAMHNALTLRALDQGLDDDRIGTYAYSNANYAVLGALIEAVAEQPYQQACASRVFAKAGVTAHPSPKTMPFLAWGGWSMTATAYAKFHRFYFGPDSAIGRDPFAFPHIAMGGGAYYGMGMVFRDFRESHNFWHFGSWCFPKRLNAGSYVVSWEQTWSVVAAYDGCLEWDQMFALDAALSAAVYPR